MRQRYCFACTFDANPGSLCDDTGLVTYFFYAHEQRPHDVYIGKTRSLSRRLYRHRYNGYPGGEMVRVFGGDFEVELHARFARHRLDGEWFRRCGDIDACLRAPLAEVAALLRAPKSAL